MVTGAIRPQEPSRVKTPYGSPVFGRLMRKLSLTREKAEEQREKEDPEWAIEDSGKIWP
jgi:hypothetical protein